MECLDSHTGNSTSSCKIASNRSSSESACHPRRRISPFFWSLLSGVLGVMDFCRSILFWIVCQRAIFMCTLNESNSHTRPVKLSCLRPRTTTKPKTERKTKEIKQTRKENKPQKEAAPPAFRTSTHPAPTSRRMHHTSAPWESRGRCSRECHRTCRWACRLWSLQHPRNMTPEDTHEWWA